MYTNAPYCVGALDHAVHGRTLQDDVLGEVVDPGRKVAGERGSPCTSGAVSLDI
jgi:hypothetical protein